VVWQGSAGDRRPYADLTRFREKWPEQDQKRKSELDQSILAFASFTGIVICQGNFPPRPHRKTAIPAHRLVLNSPPDRSTTEWSLTPVARNKEALRAH
jgi:hypothetical protein